MNTLQDFDARTVQPSQGGGAHPPGMFEFQITNTWLKDTKDGGGCMLVVEMTSPVGRIENRYNLVNPNAKAVEIGQKQLSALCHAVGIFQVKYPKNPDGTPIYDQAGITLRGGRGKMEIVPQKDGQGKETGYVEVYKVFDSNGNEPGKGPSNQTAPQGQAQGGSGWNNNQPAQQTAPQQQPPQNNNQQQPQAGNNGWNAQSQNAANQAQSWQANQQQPNNAGGGAPPWAKQ